MTSTIKSPARALASPHSPEVLLHETKSPGFPTTACPTHVGAQQTNWSKTHSCVVDGYFEPTTLDEIQSVVSMAREAGKKLRVVGSLTSHNDAAMSKDILLSLRKYNAIHMLDCDKAIVMVQAGVRVGELLEKLAPFGFTIPQCPTRLDLSLGGAIACGHHGESRAIALLASL
jgi:FAD/FMN-containing dehydrogenase